jgi:hypothetical protein
VSALSVGARVASPAAEVVDTSALALGRSGLRFARPDTEAAYRAWHREKAIPFTRVGMALSLLNWAILLGAAPIAVPHLAAKVDAEVLIVSAPAILATLYISYRPRLIGWLLPATLLACMLDGLTGIVICDWNVSIPELGGAAVCVVGFFGFTIFRVLPAQALLAVSPFFGLHEWFLVRSFQSGSMTGGVLVMNSCVVVVAMLSGVLACANIDRISRGAYRHERIVEAQHEVIERLQRAELQRQVAERSRGLSEALSRLSHAPPAPTALAAGEVVEERYKIVRAIGQGAMGEVHEVERLTDGRRLALKTMTGPAHRQALARFAREAQVAAELDHPNIVAAIDIGVTRSGILFLVMELVAGASLARERGRYGDARWARPILAQVARALAAMHARGIIHRDLKPSNILLDGATAKVADFGLAGLIDQAPFADTREVESAPSPALTHSGALLGTPRYMAPELARGANEAGPSSDVFSLGVVAFQLLANQLPHATPPVLERLAGRAAPPAKPLLEARPDLPAALCALVDRCLTESPDARPTADDFLVELST